MQPSLSAPQRIDTPAELTKLVEALKGQPSLAVDTEANSLYVYREQVCLIQFSTPQNDYIVDPLALDGLSPLAALFAADSIQKVFHAAEYDLLGLHRDFDFSFANLFDTMIATRTLGYKAVGLGDLLADKFGVKVDKHYQRADWGRRPLPDDLIDYARLDTHYLLSLRDALEQELKNAGRWELAQEDFHRSCFVNGNNHQRASRERWERIDHRQELSPRQQTVLNELCVCREEIAEQVNRPLFKVMDDRLLLRVASGLPETPQELKTAGLSERQLQRFGAALLAAVQRGKHARLVQATEIARPSSTMLNRLHRLKAWRKRRAKDMEVESDVILPRVYVHTIAEQNPRSAEALAHIMADTPWRFAHFGQEILKILNTKSAAND